MRTLLGLIATGMLVLAGCGEADRPRTEPPAHATDAASATPARPGGTLVAEVKYTGEPVFETVVVNKDVRQCGKRKQADRVSVGSNHGLLDAVVSVADAGNAAITMPIEKPTLDQKNCEFRPRVLAVTPGEVDILNSDGVLHNIHTFSTANPPINKAQPRFKKVITERFEKPEIIRVQCDVHSWMEGWIVVRPHPYFAVTDDTGTARIENVPAGKHVIDVWHPVLREQSKEVEVKAGETTRVVFELAQP